MSPSTTSKHSLNTSRDGDSTTSLGSPFQCLTTLLEKRLFLILNLNLPSRPIAVTWEQRPTPSPPQPPFGSCRAQVSPETPLLETEPSHSLNCSLWDLCSRHLRDPVTLLCTRSRASVSFLQWGAQHWTQHSRCGLTRHQRDAHLLLPVLLLIRSRMPSAILDTWALCRLTFSQASTITPRSFSCIHSSWYYKSEILKGKKNPMKQSSL